MTRRFLAVAALSVALLIPSAASAQQEVQAPARDTRPPRSGTSRIRGRVIAADTGAPLRRAIVRLSASELREPHATTTDLDGNYEFADLPGGTYYVMASKTGFLVTQYGATGLGQPGKPVKIGDGELSASIDLALQRACAIAGRVLDEFGDPVAGAMVRIYRYQSVGGSRRLMVAGGSNGATNDLGQYRVFGLQGGTYYVSAQMVGGTGVEIEDHAGYALTYYPATASIAEAAPVHVAAGQDATNIDVMLALTRTARISGVVLDMAGRPVGSGGVSATLQQQGGVPGAGASNFGPVRPDGSFVINALPAGDYVLSTTYNPGPGRDQVQYGRLRVSVGGNDLTGIAIQTSPGATLSGQVIFDGASAPPQRPKLTVSAGPVGPEMSGPAGPPAQVREDGTFTLTGAFGERLIRVGGVPTGWALKGVYLNTRDITDTPLTFEGGERLAGLQIVLTDRVTHLTGSVTDDRGRPVDTAYVLVFPDDPAKWTTDGYGSSRFVRRAVFRSEAPLKIDGMPPGDYVAVAFLPIQNLDMSDPEFLERMRKSGVKIALREGESKDLALKLIDPSAR